MAVTPDSDVRAAGGKRALVVERGGQSAETRPRAAAVTGADDPKLIVGRVAEGDAVVLVPERHGVKEGISVGARELRDPCGATVGSLEDARRVTVADAQDIGGHSIDGVHVTKVQRERRLRRHVLPCRAGVERAHHRAARPTGPRHFRTDGTDAAKRHVDATGQRRPCPLRRYCHHRHDYCTKNDCRLHQYLTITTDQQGDAETRRTQPGVTGGLARRSPRGGPVARW